MSGLDCRRAREVRKGAVDAILQAYGGDRRRTRRRARRAVGRRIARSGGTPLAVGEDGSLLGVIHLKDIVKPGIRSASRRCAAWASAR